MCSVYSAISAEVLKDAIALKRLCRDSAATLSLLPIRTAAIAVK